MVYILSREHLISTFLKSVQHKLSNEWSRDMVWDKIQKSIFVHGHTNHYIWSRGWDPYGVHQPNYFAWFVFYIGNGHFWTGDLRIFFLTSTSSVRDIKSTVGAIVRFIFWKVFKKEKSKYLDLLCPILL